MTTRVFLLALAVMTACAERAEGPRVPEWEVRPELTIGEEDGPASFSAIWDIAVDKQGRIALLLLRQNRIALFAPDGQFITDISRVRSGPGEFRAAINIEFDAKDRLWVGDFGRKVNMIFEPTGRLAAEYPRPPGVRCRMSCDLLLPDGRHVDGRLRAVAPSVFRTEIYVSDSTGVITDSLPLPLADSTPSTTAKSPPPFTRRLLYAPSPDGRTWIAMSDAYRIAAVTMRGDTTTIIDGTTERFPVTKRDRQDYEERLGSLGRLAGFATDTTSQYPKEKPPLAFLAVADNGDLWVAPASKRDGIAEWFDVYAPDGKLRARARLKFPGRIVPQSGAWLNPAPVLIVGDKLYMITMNDDDVPSLVRATIRKP